jgi:hypothetical protein
MCRICDNINGYIQSKSVEMSEDVRHSIYKTLDHPCEKLDKEQIMSLFDSLTNKKAKKFDWLGEEILKLWHNGCETK